MSRPDPDRGAIAFAEKLLTLLQEGHFTATYKYAVLLGLMDLCLEYSTRTGAAPTTVTTRQLAEKVLEMYWPHAVPFVGASVRVLRQNRPARGGGQAAIVSAITRFRERHAPDASSPMVRARHAAPRPFEKLVQHVEWKLVEMPLPRLQLVGNTEVPFLYQINWDRTVRKGEFAGPEAFDNSIRLVGKAGDHLVRLVGLLRPLIQREWSAMVARYNDDLVTNAVLERFLFGVDRVALTPVRDSLRDLQDGRCFYCGGRLRDKAEVDHFVPWSRYPNNAIENLVLADDRCNNDKRDHLAAADHVARWVERAGAHSSDLEDIADKVAWDSQPDRSLGVARAIYLRLPTGASLWLARGEFVPMERGAVRTALAGG